MVTKINGVRCVVGAVLGTVAFVALTKAQFPMPFVENTSLQARTCLLTLVAVYFDPISAFIVGFAGHAISDTVFYGGAWWSWVIPDGIAGALISIAAIRCQFIRLTSPASAAMLLYLIQVIVNMIAWAVIAPVLDCVIYGEEASLVLFQGLNAAIGNIIITGAICIPCVALYAFYRRSCGRQPVPLWDIA